MTYYIYNVYTDRTAIYIGQNKRRAISAAKARAVEVKQSVGVCAQDSNIKGWLYIGIAEYPYYLRELNLDPRDIIFNRFE